MFSTQFPRSHGVFVSPGYVSFRALHQPDTPWDVSSGECVISLFYSGIMLCFSNFSSCRDCFYYHRNCAGLWTLYSCGPCKSDQLFLGLEGHYLHLALLLGMGRSTSPGLEQVHAGHTWTRLHRGLEIQECQRLLFCALLISWLPGGACGCHSPLLRPYSVFGSNASLCGRPSDNSSDQDFKIWKESGQNVLFYDLHFPDLLDALCSNPFLGG